MWVARESNAASLLTIVEKLLFGEPSLKERPRVDSGRTVPLDKDQIAAVSISRRVPEMAEADIIEGAADWKLAMCPPSSELSLLARRTIASAFQRIRERSLCSIARSPGSGGYSSTPMVLQ